MSHTPNAGSLAGDTFLVIDANGIAGYRAGQDLVVELINPGHINQLSVGDFV